MVVVESPGPWRFVIGWHVLSPSESLEFIVGSVSEGGGPSKEGKSRSLWRERNGLTLPLADLSVGAGQDRQRIIDAAPVYGRKSCSVAVCVQHSDDAQSPNPLRVRRAGPRMRSWASKWPSAQVARPALYSAAARNASNRAVRDRTRLRRVHVSSSVTVPVMVVYPVRVLSNRSRSFLAPGVLWIGTVALAQPPTPSTQGLIGRKHLELGGEEGPLGKPTSPEVDAPEGTGRMQSFERGVIGWSPNTGPESLQVLYLREQELVFTWGETTPFNYDFFLVRWDLDGTNLGQDEVEGSRTGGTWTHRVVKGGRYRVVVEGGDRSALGSTFKQGWSNPLHMDFSPPPPEYARHVPSKKETPPEARPFDPRLMPEGLYLEEWMRLGGPNGPLGVPTNTVQPHRDGGAGGYVPFENGQVVHSADVWENGIFAAYQDGLGVRVDWLVSWGDPEPPSHYHYDRFILRWDRDGRNVGQIDIDADETHLRTRGSHWIQPLENGTYEIRVEGADVPTVGSVTARQGWMHPATVRVQWPRADGDAIPNRQPALIVSHLPPVQTVAESQDQFDRRTAAAILFHACQPLPHTIFRNEGNYGVIALAKLAYPDYFDSDRLPGQTRPVREEVITSLRWQEVGSKAGTSQEGIPKRTGEYDVALTMLTAIVYRHYEDLPPDVQNHLIHGLLNKNGPFDPYDALPFHPLPVPETENHLLMIEVARYLTNQVLHRRDLDPAFDNEHNYLDDWMLDALRRFLVSDFVEYNARPYQDYTLSALLNLYSYTSDRHPSSARVKTAARMVLDYVFAKAAISSNDSRRCAPYRRKATYDSADFVDEHYDPMNAFTMLLAGTTGVAFADSPTGKPKGWLPGNHAWEWQWAGLSDYRIPELVLDLMIDRTHRRFLQKLHHSSEEVYASSPSYLISAGGSPSPHAYVEDLSGGDGFGSDDDRGRVVPTTLIPTGQFTSRNDVIRFEGAPARTEHWNLGVTHDFACGLNPVIPEAYRSVALGVDGEGNRRLHDLGTMPWIFIDQGKPTTGVYASRERGYFVAIYRQEDFGFLEAFDVSLHPDVTFDGFVNSVLQRHAGRAFERAGRNEWQMLDGRRIEFELVPQSAVIEPFGDPYFASGDILRSPIGSGIVSIENPWLRRRIILDASDFREPRRTESSY